MPIYEYECKKCGVTFEMMQPVSAKPLATCAGIGCKGKADGKVQRIVSASGFILKGSGWYATDYPSDARKKGWDQENKAANPAAADAHKCGSGCGHGPSGAEKTESKAADTAQPEKEKKATSKPNGKNPYSSGKKKTKKSP